MDLPEQISSEEQLDELLTRPSPDLVEFIKTLTSPLLVLGAGGKMGPTLAVLAKRAAETGNYRLEIFAISRFGNSAACAWLRDHQVKTLACDLMDTHALQELPDTSNLIYLVGQKFGTTENPAGTWAINTIGPAHVAERYSNARIVALSTGNVYPATEIGRGGSVETDALTPLGEYANATVGRERIFQFYSQRRNIQVTLLRLFYAVELRYGVLVDVARKVQTDEPIELANGYFNCIWQGDANEMTLRSLALATSPPSVWNLCRPERFSVREVGGRFGDLLGKSPRFIGVELPNALLGNSSQICAQLGAPSVALESMMRWIAHWVQRGGRYLDKPTHFEVRDGKY